jgi:hypothetical protein
VEPPSLHSAYESKALNLHHTKSKSYILNQKSYMPEGAITAGGYNAINDIHVDTAVAAQPQIGSNNKPASFKGSWTVQEDKQQCKIKRFSSLLTSTS